MLAASASCSTLMSIWPSCVPVPCSPLKVHPSPLSPVDSLGLPWRPAEASWGHTYRAAAGLRNQHTDARKWLRGLRAGLRMRELAWGNPQLLQGGLQGARLAPGTAAAHSCLSCSTPPQHSSCTPAQTCVGRLLGDAWRCQRCVQSAGTYRLPGGARQPVSAAAPVWKHREQHSGSPVRQAARACRRAWHATTAELRCWPPQRLQARHALRCPVPPAAQLAALPQAAEDARLGPAGGLLVHGVHGRQQHEDLRAQPQGVGLGLLPRPLKVPPPRAVQLGARRKEPGRRGRQPGPPRVAHAHGLLPACAVAARRQPAAQGRTATAGRGGYGCTRTPAQALCPVTL